MSRASKRTIAELDEDPDDSDFAETSPTKRARKRTGKDKERSASSKNKGLPRRKDRYKGSDVEDDEDDSDDDEIEDVSDEPSSPIVVNPFTGRPSRRSAQAITYEEPDSDDDPIATRVESDDDRPAARSTVNRSQQATSLVVKLKVPSLKTQSRGRGKRSRGGSHASESDAMQSAGSRRGGRRSRPESRDSEFGGARRSSRISHSEEKPLLSLTDSGRHQRVERAASSTPVPIPQTRIREGAKRVPTTSAIIEASQEDIDELDQAHGEPGRFTQDVEEQEGDDDGGGGRDPVEADDPEASSSEGPQGSAADPVAVAESVQGDVTDDEDDDPVKMSRRRSSARQAAAKTIGEEQQSTRRTRGSQRSPRRVGYEEDGSDFEPPGEEPEDEDMSGSEISIQRPKESQKSEDSSNGRRSTRLKRKREIELTSENTDIDERTELAGELAELKTAGGSKRRRRRRSDDVTAIAYEPPARRTRGDRRDYTIRPEMWPTAEEDDQPMVTSRTLRGGRTGGGYRSLWDTRGPFGLTGGPPPAFTTPTAAIAAVESDSSDDEVQQSSRAPRVTGGTIGMTPTVTNAPIHLFPPANDSGQGATGGPANLGRIKDRKALADADPLGVDQNVDFDGVGGLKSHINQLKEMVMLPLLYPEVFQRFHVTPPRGVLFHGPPGTGKTLLARALANSVSEGGQKITFYMRKGADTLSKYVGEAERQLRLLFEDARKNQPSIIFFDEIDGLAPVRSSKQDQIHATIVTTLLALMDGMDGRGQVIIIGATNRPDTVDSALRRPGRFDREFYFPLPDVDARAQIINIHTKGWDPPLKPEFKEQLASLTNGYGGADLRALCTEAALNAVQGTYPQIYQSTEKLLIDPSTIKVMAKDFMISVNKIVPSSQRATASSAAPLDKRVEPLLRQAFNEISANLDGILPSAKKLTALEEAKYDDRDDTAGFQRELMQQNFDQARVFRPRMLVYGNAGMGQHFIGQALLHKFERLHVQNLDLSVLYSDSARSPQAAVIQLFNEARRHKPSVIYIPDVHLWYETVEPSVIKLFTGLLHSLPPNEPVLLLATLNTEKDQEPRPDLLRDLFGFSRNSHYKLKQPGHEQRREFFSKVVELMSRAPSEFPDPDNRKKREIVTLPRAPTQAMAVRAPNKAELKTQKLNDNMTMNLLKIKLGYIMEQLKREYKAFRRPAIDPDAIAYLFDEQNPNMIGTDVPEDQRDLQERPFVFDKDHKGVGVIRDVATGNKYYNLEIVTIEHRLSNGYYKRSSDFVADIKRLGKDAKTLGDTDKILKANKMLTNVEVDVDMIDKSDPALKAECERVYQRDLERETRQQEKARQAVRVGQPAPTIISNVPPQVSETTDNSGPVLLGQPLPGRAHVPPNPQERFKGTPVSNSLSNGISNGVDYSQHASNGVDSDEEMHVANSQEQPSSGEQRRASGHETQSQPLSQTTYITPIAPGSHAHEYHNSASTTTSEQKTSKSRSSGQNTQSTNGVRSEQPDLNLEISGGSQLPDTQATSPQYAQTSNSPPNVYSQPSQSSPPQEDASQVMPPPAPAHRGSIPAILNDPETAPEPTLILDASKLATMLDELVTKSSGFSVEQLEQMNAQLMDSVWRKRTQWNRTRVIKECGDEAANLVRDMSSMQSFLSNSQKSADELERGGIEPEDIEPEDIGRGD